MTQVELPRHLYAASQARLLVEEFECDLDPVGRGDAILAVSELVTNAYLYGAGPIHLRLEPAGRGLRAAIECERNGQTGNGDDHREFRLGLVRGLSDQWGMDYAGTVTWFEIGTEGPAHPDESPAYAA
jgi:two-component sensor histidine kinase